MRTSSTAVTVGSGRSIHWGSDCGTMCGAAHRSGRFTEPKLVNAETATCKRCVKIMAAEVETTHAEALTENAKREDAQAVAAADVQHATVWVSTEDGAKVTVTRVAAHPFPRVSFRHLDGSTGTLPLPWFLERYTRSAATELELAHAEAQEENAARAAAKRAEETADAVTAHQLIRAEFAAASQELKAMDLAASAKLVALVSGSPETAYPEAVKLDTWLTEGLVLVGPATDSLYVFENWGPGGAVLRHVDTGALETVAQADVTEWKYLPGVGSEEILPAEVRVGDVIKFHSEGSYRTISGKVRHEGTDLYSFSIEGSATQFVRGALELVCRKELPTRG